jgi:hypothetical protein
MLILFSSKLISEFESVTIHVDTYWLITKSGKDQLLIPNERISFLGYIGRGLRKAHVGGRRRRNYYN